MGKEIERLALEKGHKIVAKVDNTIDWGQQRKFLLSADVAIEFSIAATAPENIIQCFELSIPVVSGTTGWLSRMDEINQICTQNNQTLFYAPNFSIGVNIFFEINKQLAQFMKHFDDYDISIEEAHHVHKVDAPSGTAIRLASDIIKEIEHINSWKESEKAGNKDIGITSIREGNITGTHTVTYDSPFEKIGITHSAKNRKVFAAGALMAAEWLQGKTGIYGMNDLLVSLLKK